MGVLIVRDPLFGVYIRAADCWKLPDKTIRKRRCGKSQLLYDVP